MQIVRNSASPELLDALREAMEVLYPIVLARHGSSSAGTLKISECDRELCAKYNRWRTLINTTEKIV